MQLPHGAAHSMKSIERVTAAEIKPLAHRHAP